LIPASEMIHGRRVLLVERPGWHSDRFQLGSETVGDGKEPIILGDKLGSHLARVAQRGTLEDWKANIADVASTSSYLVFTLSAGFAAPLLRLTGVENGGFHFWAPSSRGKSTLQAFVGTIYGSGERHDKRYSRDWNITDTASSMRSATPYHPLTIYMDGK
jgi:putative DNA primase/helicase